MADFVRGANGSVIGIALEAHPDAAPDAEAPTSMIPILPIPENAFIGDLPDVIQQADQLAAANDRVAAANARIAELEAAAAASAAAQVPADPAASSSSSASGTAPDWNTLAGAPAPAAGDTSPAPGAPAQ
jgi:hypothetical protein